ncbi:MAG: hypothetical protein H7145_00195 [Akkermansiaceae bacterium]|nr:hypothetical protein [Armatimonadota bacterium]
MARTNPERDEPEMSHTRFLLAAGMTAVVACGTLVTVRGARADAPAENQSEKPIRIQLGVFLPSDHSIRDRTGDAYFSAGLGYDLKALSRRADRSEFQSGPYLDFASRERGGFQLTDVAVGLQSRVYFAPKSRLRPYVGAGLGGYYIKYRQENGSDDRKFTLGGKAILGLQDRSGLYFETNYTLIEKVRGDLPGGFNLQLGYRF